VQDRRLKRQAAQLKKVKDPAVLDSTTDADSEGPDRKRKRTEKNDGHQLHSENL
jgi:transcription elongation GreA/GreB family factor